jgi:anhydro-N-acetylmuramic acid kinase
MLVAGIMSGTSADGIDVALVEISGAARSPRLQLRGHAAFPYPSRVRRAVLAAMNAPAISVAHLARLNFLLGELYADAVAAAQKQFRLRPALVGCHGQTLYHQGKPAPFLGRRLAVTWQTGEAACIAARLGVPVVSDFRPADMAYGGKGAPLVPYLDYLLYRDPRIGRIALNLGGIANLTAIPPHASPEKMFAFDTGPGNMVIDALMGELFAKAFDRDGEVSAAGHASELVVHQILRRRFFRQPPPKTAGREEFGREFVARFEQQWRRAVRSTKKTRPSKAGLIATATLFTARSIADAVTRHVLPRGKFSEVVASGGGTRNPTLMAMLAHEFSSLGLALRTSDDFGIPSEAKEAVAFAVLAYETWRRRPSNVPSATGARRPAVLGKVAYP